jgi:hypothetical protein
MFQKLFVTIDDISATIIESAQTKTHFVSLNSLAIGLIGCDLCLKFVSYILSQICCLLVSAWTC